MGKHIRPGSRLCGRRRLLEIIRRAGRRAGMSCACVSQLTDKLFPASSASGLLGHVSICLETATQRRPLETTALSQPWCDVCPQAVSYVGRTSAAAA